MISIFIILNNFSSLNTFYLNFISSQSWAIAEIDSFYFLLIYAYHIEINEKPEK